MEFNRRKFLAGASGLAALSLGVGTARAATELKYGHFSPTSDPHHVTAETFAGRIGRDRGGDYSVKVFPNSQLGGELDAIEGVLLGTIDISVPSAATLANFVPEMNVLNMPFAFRDWDHYTKLALGLLQAQMTEFAAVKNIRILAMLTSGARHIITREPLNSFEELKGRKIRTVQNPVHVATFNAFGAKSTAIAFPEVYSSLQTGVVDGADSANTAYLTQKFYEVAPNTAQVAWLFYSNCMIMREDSFQALPASMRDLLIDAGKQAGDEGFKRYRESEDASLGKLVAAGVKVTEPDRAPFQAASKQIYEEFIKADAEKDLLKAILAE